MPGLGIESLTVPGDGDAPVSPVERFLAYLTAIGLLHRLWNCSNPVSWP